MPSAIERQKFGAIARLDKWDPKDLAKKTKFEKEFQLKFANDKSHTFKKGMLLDKNCNEAGTHVDCSFVHLHDEALVAMEKLGIRPIETLFSENAVVNNGLTDFNTGLTTAGLATPFNNANAKIGVGDTATATTLADTDLKAAALAANRWTQGMDATYPTLALGVLTFRATFATGNANHVWNEWVVSNSASTGATALTRILNRAVAALGTKTSAQSWQFTPTITLA